MPALGSVSTTVGPLVRVAAVGYALGSIPVADVVAGRAGGDDGAGTDLRSAGSGNPGASNVGKLHGRKAGAIVFAGDVAKAYIACRIGHRVGGTAAAHISGSASVIGHCYPVTRGFHGGKGVAASFGQMLATFPAYLPVDLALGVAMARTERWKDDAAMATSAACALWVALGAIWWRRDLPNAWGGEPSPGLPLAAAASSAAIITRFVTHPDRSRHPESENSDAVS